MEPPSAPPGVPTATRFDPVAGPYARARPEYPPEAVARIGAVFGLRADSRLLDLAAGTGKLTRSIRAVLPVRLIAVEPSREMRREFATAAPGVPLVTGRAERLPIRDRSVRAVAVGQAFHWFRGPEATAEIARVLRPGGGIAILYNHRDTRVPWMARFDPLLHSIEPKVPESNRDGEWSAPVTDSPDFGPLTEERFPSVHPVSPEGLVDLAHSRSYVSAMAPEARSEFLDRVRAFVAHDPDLAGRPSIEVPYVTELRWARRR